MQGGEDSQQLLNPKDVQRLHVSDILSLWGTCRDAVNRALMSGPCTEHASALSATNAVCMVQAEKASNTMV